MKRMDVAEELSHFSLVTPVDDAHVSIHRLIQRVIQHLLLLRLKLPPTWWVPAANLLVQKPLFYPLV